MTTATIETPEVTEPVEVTTNTNESRPLDSPADVTVTVDLTEDTATVADEAVEDNRTRTQKIFAPVESLMDRVGQPLNANVNTWANRNPALFVLAVLGVLTALILLAFFLA